MGAGFEAVTVQEAVNVGAGIEAVIVVTGMKAVIIGGLGCRL